MKKLILEKYIKEEVNPAKIKVFGFEIYPFDWYDLESERGAIKLEDVPYNVRRQLAREILNYPSNIIKKIYNDDETEIEDDKPEEIEEE